MRGLEDQERAIIVLRLHANLNMREVAEVLGQPRGTVSSTYYRALRKLRDRLGDL
jgi:RNA polymerase sigma factor (sigma-70 family)